VRHFASPDFWYHYRQLPENIRALADKNFVLLKTNPRHPSLRLKKAGVFWSARGDWATAPWARSEPRASSGSGSAPTPNTMRSSNSDPTSLSTPSATA